MAGSYKLRGGFGEPSRPSVNPVLSGLRRKANLPVRSGVFLGGTYRLGGASVFSASDHALPRGRPTPAAVPILERREDNMSTTTLLIIIVLLLVLGGGGFYGRGRWY